MGYTRMQQISCPFGWWSPSDPGPVTFSSDWRPPPPTKPKHLNGYIKLGKPHEAHFGFLRTKKEGYFWGKARKISNPIFCPLGSTCEAEQDRHFSISWKNSSTAPFTIQEAITLAQPKVHRRFIAESVAFLNSTVVLSFAGPGTAYMVVYPLYWRVLGTFESIHNVRGKVKFSTKSMYIDFPIIDNRRNIFGRLSLSR